MLTASSGNTIALDGGGRMLERRRTPRYELGEMLPADAMPMQDVVVERFADDRLIVIAHSAPTPHEQLMIHMATSEGLASRHAEVISSHPITVAGAMCYRLELQLGPADPSHETGPR
jgi:hypothetical protein